jgi:mannosyltransferase OCH1-like enzyme
MIARYFPTYLEAYQNIRIPACRSDIARLVALHEWGGLYVDCHCGIRDAKRIGQLLGFLDSMELIVFTENPMGRLKSRPADHEHWNYICAKALGINI